MYVIAFNGPPRSGKDSIANELVNQLGLKDQAVKRLQLSLPMRKAVFALLGQEYTEAKYESVKDNTFDAFQGRTLRQAMIALSESHVKPTYGHGFWVKSSMYTCNRRVEFAIISDLGFPIELAYLERKFPTLIVNTIRKGATWAGDSRVPLEGCLNLVVENNGSIKVAAKKIRDYIVNTLGWLAR